MCLDRDRPVEVDADVPVCAVDVCPAGRREDDVVLPDDLPVLDRADIHADALTDLRACLRT